MTDLGTSDDVRIELAYDLEAKEIDDVKEILNTQLPGYTLVESLDWTVTVFEISEGDVSPSLAELQKRLPKVGVEPRDVDCEVPLQPVYTGASDLRLYLVTLTSPDEDQTPRSVVIDYGAGQVVAFG